MAVGHQFHLNTQQKKTLKYIQKKEKHRKHWY